MKITAISKEILMNLRDRFKSYKQRMISGTENPEKAGKGNERFTERRRASKRERVFYYAHIFSEGLEDRRKNYTHGRTV